MPGVALAVPEELRGFCGPVLVPGASGLSFSRPVPPAYPFRVRCLRPILFASGASGLSFSRPVPPGPLRYVTCLRPFVFTSGPFVGLFFHGEWPAFVFTSGCLRASFSITPGRGTEILLTVCESPFVASGGSMAVAGALGCRVLIQTWGLSWYAAGVPEPFRRRSVSWVRLAASGAWSGGCCRSRSWSLVRQSGPPVPVGQGPRWISASIMCSASVAGSGGGASSWRSASAWARSASGPCPPGPRVPMVFRSW